MLLRKWYVFFKLIKLEIIILKMIKYFYAVKRGFKTGIFESWDECKKATCKYSNPEFLRCSTKEEAEAYLKGLDYYNEMIKTDLANGYVVAFTDGSFDKQSNKYSYGIVMIESNGSKTHLCAANDDKKFKNANNIIGEVFGVINAIDWAISHNYSKIKIYHDYEGLSKWAKHEWNAESQIAKFYLSKIESKYKEVIKIDFHWVKGHSNNKYNELADSLAKNALKSGTKLVSKGQSYFVISNINKDDLDAVISILKEEFKNISSVVERKNNKDTYKLSYGKEALNITLFSSGKLLVQGKMSYLFQIFTSLICELIDDREIVKVLKDAYQYSFEQKLLDDGWCAYCSNIPQEYNSNIRKLLKQSIINLYVYVESFDYGGYVFPALRALEGHIKILLGNIGITINKEFNCFEKNNRNCYVLNSITPIGNNHLIADIEKCYNYYSSFRHSIFHFDIVGETDSARMISKKEDADEIILKCLQLINETV